MNSSSVVNNALIEVRRVLKGRGFSAKGRTFHRKIVEGNTILISIQKSVKSSALESEIAINYGVYSARIGARLQDDSSLVLDVMSAHWRKRLKEGGREKWLHVKATDSVDESARIILEAIESVLPELVEHARDEDLRDEWLSGASPGLVDMERLLFASIVVNEIGPAESLKDVVGELRRLVAGSIHEGLVERRLARAGVQVM